MFKLNWMAYLIVALLVIAGLSAASQTKENIDTALIALTHIAQDVPAIDVYIDNNLLREDVRMSDPVEYIRVAPGNHLIDITLPDDPVVLIKTTEVALEAGHTYQLVLIGLQADWSVELIAIDETAEHQRLVSEGGATPHLVINSITDAPALDVYMNDSLVVEDLDFGEYRFVDMSVEPVVIRITFANMPHQVIFDSGDAPERALLEVYCLGQCSMGFPVDS